MRLTYARSRREQACSLGYGREAKPEPRASPTSGIHVTQSRRSPPTPRASAALRHLSVNHEIDVCHFCSKARVTRALPQVDVNDI